MTIHPTAIIDSSAELADTVTVGPYAIIEAGVQIGHSTTIGPHCVIHRGVRLGEQNVLSAHVVLGGHPQDRKHDPDAPSRVTIGDRNTFREFVTVHCGSSSGTLITQVGDDNYFMANSHVAHDCTVGHGVMFANSVAIGGHAQVGDGAILGGLAAVHQHGRIGRLAMIGGGAMCNQDVPPFTVAQGDRARLFGLNIIGLRRAGMSNDDIAQVKQAWRVLFTSGLPRRAGISRAREQNGDHPLVAELLEFIEQSERGVCRTSG